MRCRSGRATRANDCSDTSPGTPMTRRPSTPSAICSRRRCAPWRKNSVCHRRSSTSPRARILLRVRRTRVISESATIVPIRCWSCCCADIRVSAKPPVIASRHRCEDLLQETFVVLSDTDLFDPDRPITLEQYLSAPHALVSATGTMRGRIDETLANLGLSRTVRAVTESFAALPFLLRSSGLIVNVPRLAGAEIAQAFGMTIHELPFASPSFPVAMIWRLRDEQNAALRWMREQVREQLVGARKQSVLISTDN